MNLQKVIQFAGIALVVSAADVVLGVEPHGATMPIPDRSNWSSVRSNENYLLRLVTEANDALLKGDDAAGIIRCNRALALNPDKKVAAFLYFLRAEAYAEKNRDQAMKDAEAAIRSDPSGVFGYLARGVLNSRWWNYKAAIADLNEVIRRDPKQVQAYSYRGANYEALGNLDQAFGDFTQAIRVEPRNARLGDAYYNRAYLYLAKHNYKAAMSDFQVALRREKGTNPLSHAYTLGSIAAIKAQCPDITFRDGKKAVELARKACDLSKWKSPDHIDVLASAYAECGNFDQAINYGTQAARMKDPDPDTPPRQKDFFAEQRRHNLRLYKEHKVVHEDYKLPPF